MKDQCPYYDEKSWNIRIEMILSFVKIPLEDRPPSTPNYSYLCNVGYHSVFGGIDSNHDVEFLKTAWNDADADQAYPYQTYIGQDSSGTIYFYEHWSPECYQGLKKANKLRYRNLTKDEIDVQFDKDFRQICSYFGWIYHGTAVNKAKCRYTVTRFSIPQQNNMNTTRPLTEAKLKQMILEEIKKNKKNT
jgi:hypothetical protein